MRSGEELDVHHILQLDVILLKQPPRKIREGICTSKLKCKNKVYMVFNMEDGVAFQSPLIDQ